MRDDDRPHQYIPDRTPGTRMGRELAELERTDPAVAKAARRYEEVKEKIVKESKISAEEVLLQLVPTNLLQTAKGALALAHEKGRKKEREKYARLVAAARPFLVSFRALPDLPREKKAREALAAAVAEIGGDDGQG